MLTRLFQNNRTWAARIKAQDPNFFNKLSKQQRPEYLWVGCSDSRVPANQIVGLLPGEVFVHRNVANIVAHSDLNCLAVMQFAVDVLKVRHIIVCGHYGCVGVQAVLGGERHGLVDNWLRYVEDVRAKHADRLTKLRNDQTRANRLCELNVIEQVRNVCQTTVVQDAWKRRQPLAVHGWVYAVSDGLLRDVFLSVPNPRQADKIYQTALRSVWGRRMARNG